MHLEGSRSRLEADAYAELGRRLVRHGDGRREGLKALERCVVLTRRLLASLHNPTEMDGAMLLMSRLGDVAEASIGLGLRSSGVRS